MSLFAGYRVSIHGDPRWAVKITDWGRSSSRGGVDSREETPRDYRVNREKWEYYVPLLFRVRAIFDARCQPR